MKSTTTRRASSPAPSAPSAYRLAMLTPYQMHMVADAMAMRTVKKDRAQ